MNKRGFTLLEILTVLVIISVVGTSSMIVFGNIDEETSQKDSENIYKDIQRAGTLYVELKDDFLNDFVTRGEMLVPLYELISTNFFSGGMEVAMTNEDGTVMKDAAGNTIKDIKVYDPYTNEEIDATSRVKIYVAEKTLESGKKFRYQNSCIVRPYYEGDVEKYECVANSEGKVKDKNGNKFHAKHPDVADSQVDTCCPNQI